MPPKTTRRHRQGAESRERILEAALEIAAERGYDGTTMALVTERTGLPASSVYWHFRNKDALVAEALEHSYRQWRLRSPAPVPGEELDEPGVRIRRRFEEMQAGLTSSPEFWRLGLMLGLLRVTQPIAARERFLQVRQETEQALEGWWADVLPPGYEKKHPDLAGILTQLLVAAGDGLLIAAQTERDWDFADLTDALSDAFAVVAPQLAVAPRRRTRTAARPARRAQPAPQPEDSRERLLVAAAQTAAERGYVGTTISRVCERSGLPVSSLYWFFEDKDALLAAVVQHSFEQWLAAQPEITPASDADERDAVLRTVLRGSLRSFEGAPDFLRIGHMVSLERQETETAARALFLDIRHDVERQLTDWFRSTLPRRAADRDARARTLARLLIAVTDGLFLAEQIDDREWDHDQLADALVAVLAAVAVQRRTTTARPSTRRRPARSSA